MTSSLDVHPASPAELIAAHTNVFDIWSKGLPLDQHIAYRLNSPSHRRATWFVGTLDGQVVVSLGSYPVRFHLYGGEVPGIAIGSVYTLKAFRGQGHAPRLLAEVEKFERSRGAQLSVLYSDIDPNYYARLGYQLCPSLEGWRKPAVVDTGYKLVAFLPSEHLAELAALYRGYHGKQPLAFARDDDYWQVMLKKFADDTFCWVVDAKGVRQGYLRVGRRKNEWRVTDYALSNDTAELATGMYAAFLTLAAGNNVDRVGGWLPDSPAARRFFELTPRKTEITMFKRLVGDAPLADAAIAAAHQFCELDHV